MKGPTGDRKLWIGLAVSLVMTVVLVRTVEPARLADAFRQMEWWYLIPATLSTFASYFLRAVRWQQLLSPVKQCPLRSLYPVTIIGYMANNILPARLGELIRAFLLAQRESIPKGTSLASLVLDRVLDGFSVLVIVVLTLLLLQLPAGMDSVSEAFRGGAAMIAVFYLGVLFFLGLLIYRRAMAERLVARMVSPLPERLADAIRKGMASFVDGVVVPKRLAGWFGLVASSTGIWFTALLPIHLVLNAFGLHLPFVASLFIMVFLVLAVMVPASPGYLGTYHAACTYALMAFSVDKDKALGIAVVIHGLNFLPVIIAGFYYLWRLDLKLGKLQHGVEENTER